jgi:hypothetical protein
MIYQKGDQVTAAVLNSFLTTVNGVFGTGTGDAGYGQTSLQGAVSVGGLINSAHWTNLRSMVVTAATHQGTAITTLPTTTVLQVGAVITAHEIAAPSSNAYELSNYITAINTNRLTAASGAMSIITGSTITRASAWATTITCTMDAIWASEDAARFFFNSGGQIRLNFSQPTGSGTAQDTDWNAILATKLGEVRLGSYTTTNAGSTSMANGALGFYGLTTSPQAIVTGTNVGGGAYSSNDVSVTAQVLNKVGVNGGNGNTVRFVVLLSDQHTGVTDSVSSGTAAAFSTFKATTYLTGIATPTFTVQTAF